MRVGAASLFEGANANAEQAQGPPAASRGPASPGRALCQLFESLQSRHARQQRGAFYTPADIVERTVSWTLAGVGGGATHRPTADAAALDPACGGGAFLCELADRLAPDRVYGIDIDPLAVAVARAALTLDFGDLPGIDGRIVLGDALTRRAPGPGEGGFDYVLGNPPYASLNGRVGPRFAHLFDRTRPNAFGAFLERSAAWVRPGGRIGLVLPRTLVRVAAYEPLRRLLAGAGAVERLADVGEATPGVGFEQLIVVIAAGAPPGQTEVRRWVAGKPELVRMTVPQGDLLGGGPIPLGLDAPGLGLLRRLQREGPSLGEVADIFRGLALSVRDPLVSATPRPGWVPVLRGADVGRDGVRGNAWLDEASLGPRRLVAKRARLRRPRIVMPNVVSSLIAANATWDPDGLLALDTVTSVVPDEAGPPAAGVLAALQSALGTWVLRHGIFGRNRLTNHMDRPYLGRFPLPPVERWPLLTSDVAAAYGLTAQEREVATPR